MERSRRSFLFLSIAVTPALLALSCSDHSGNGASSFSTGTGTGGGSASSGTSGLGGGVLFTTSTGSMTHPIGPFHDFPADPILDTGVPANAADLFGAADSGSASGGPCLFEPEPDTLYPNNWLRPRFSWNAGQNENLFELRLHTTADVEVQDLVVYTAGSQWTMPKDMWTKLAYDAEDAPITITVRGAQLTGTTLAGPPSLGSTQTMTVAPAPAAGAIVYWTTSGGSSLKGFSAGDETVVTALQPSQVKMATIGDTAVTCVGCHTSTPDGSFVGFTAQGPWGNALASIVAGSVGAQPAFVGAGAVTTLQALQPLGIQTYSKAHWTQGDHVMIAPYRDSKQFGGSAAVELAWIDLEATTSAQGTSYDFLARTGDTNDVGAPTWSHDGKTIVYVSTDAEKTGRLDNGVADLFAVPYNDRKGGAAKAVTGAADANLEEYYPAFSPDDAWLAFNRVPSGTSMYGATTAEVFVIPAAGGTAVKLAANAPPACTGKTSPGVTNSWPKWAPQVTAVGQKRYYWMIFSSTRDPLGSPQLYITGVVVDGTKVETHGALYLWNQPADEHNHTPAWDFFMIPPPPEP